MERNDKQIVQKHVGNAGGHRKGKSESRAPCRYKEGLEQRLEKTDRGKGKDRPQIGGTVIHQHRRCTEQTADLTAKQVAEHCAQNTDDQCGKGKGRKVTVGFLLFFLSDLCGNNGAASGTEHDADGKKNADGRIDDIGGGKRHAVHVLCDEKAIHNTVERHKDHHDDRWKRKLQQRAEVEILGE